MTTSYALGRIIPRQQILQSLVPTMTPRFAFYLPDFLSEKHARVFSTVVETRIPSAIAVLVGLDGFVLLQLTGDPDTSALESRLAKWHLETACE